MSKDQYVTLRVDTPTKQYLKKMAERERRTLTNLLQVIIADAVDRDKAKVRQ